MTDPTIQRHSIPAGATVFAVDTGRFLLALFLGCLIIELALVYLDLTVNWLRWAESGALRRLFNITREDALASWFAVSQTLLVALVLWLLLAVAVQQRVPATQRFGWLLLALFFTYMCIDDGAAVHERIGSAFSDASGAARYPSYAWQFLLLPFFALMGLFTLVFLWRQMPRPAERIRVLAALACFAAAVALDFVEGLDGGYAWLVQSFGWEAAAIRHFSKSIEEFLEMLGMSILLVSFLGALAGRAPHLAFRFTPAR